MILLKRCIEKKWLKKLNLKYNMDISNEQFKQQAGKLLKYMMEKLKIESPPVRLVLKQNEENAKQSWGYTGNYDPDSKTITVFITNRHHVDVLRSFAHEVIHHWQNENGQLQGKEVKPENQYAQKDPHMRKMEKQAYLLGNMIFRDFEDVERFGETEIVNEGELTHQNGNLAYSDEDALEDERLAKAERYFSIGQDDEESDNNYCWAWLDGRLQFKKGGTHGINFGHHRTNETYKGWYDTNTGTLSFVFPHEEGKSVDDIPPRVLTALQRKFNPQHIEVF